jgi:4'-phosphopantetheinyl transferase EntD
MPAVEVQNFTSLFDSLAGVTTIWTEIAAMGGELLEDERQYVTQAVGKRVNEFTAGRTLARLALTRIGADAVSIPVNEDRTPVWPPGFTGSISHTDTRVAVSVCRTADFSGLGLDIERARSMPMKLVDSVFTDREKREFAGCSLDPTSLFSCKEAVYKAVYPLCGEFLDFHDVEIAMIDDRFTARCDTRKKSSTLIGCGHGLMQVGNDHLATIFSLKS